MGNRMKQNTLHVSLADLVAHVEDVCSDAPEGATPDMVADMILDNWEPDEFGRFLDDAYRPAIEACAALALARRPGVGTIVHYETPVTPAVSGRIAGFSGLDVIVEFRGADAEIASEWAEESGDGWARITVRARTLLAAQNAGPEIAGWKIDRK